MRKTVAAKTTTMKWPQRHNLDDESRHRHDEKEPTHCTVEPERKRDPVHDERAEPEPTKGADHNLYGDGCSVHHHHDERARNEQPRTKGTTPST